MFHGLRALRSALAERGFDGRLTGRSDLGPHRSRWLGLLGNLDPAEAEKFSPSTSKPAITARLPSPNSPPGGQGAATPAAIARAAGPILKRGTPGPAVAQGGAGPPRWDAPAPGHHHGGSLSGPQLPAAEAARQSGQADSAAAAGTGNVRLLAAAGRGFAAVAIAAAVVCRR